RSKRDWSSDVCSSDLIQGPVAPFRDKHHVKFVIPPAMRQALIDLQQFPKTRKSKHSSGIPTCLFVNHHAKMWLSGHEWLHFWLAVAMGIVVPKVRKHLCADALLRSVHDVCGHIREHGKGDHQILLG